jgi:hypothetical protein
MLGRRFRTMFSMVLALGLAGSAMTSNADAGFYKVIPPPTGTGGNKEVDPPPEEPPPPTSQSPEPGTLALAVLGGATIAAWRRKKA